MRSSPSCPRWMDEEPTAQASESGAPCLCRLQAPTTACEMFGEDATASSSAPWQRLCGSSWTAHACVDSHTLVGRPSCLLLSDYDSGAIAAAGRVSDPQLCARAVSIAPTTGCRCRSDCSLSFSRSRLASDWRASVVLCVSLSLSVIDAC